MLFDTHAHLLDERFDEDRDRLILSLPSLGVGRFIECASDMDTSARAVALAEKYAMAYAAVGVHPHDAKSWDEGCKTELRALAKRGKVVAVGEIGLDYHYDFSPRETQRQVFRRQLALAGDLGLPVAVHSREAAEDTMRILTEFPGVTGVLHCFSGSVETMREAVRMGYCVSFGGSVTFKNARKPAEAAAAVPLDRLLLETDSPYMTPVPLRGRRNSPANVGLVAEKIAEIRGMSPAEVEAVTTENAGRFFGIGG